MNHGSDPAIGIDLGTTYSVIAFRDVDGRPTTLRNAEGDLTTPSVVYFDPSEIVVGKEAAKVAPFEPDRVAQFAKRDIGRSQYHREIGGQRLPPEVIEALVVKKLKEDAWARLGEFNKAVVTVPAYFNEPRRKATQDAGRLAGLDVIDIINEPTAAAIAFGVQEGFLTERGEAHERELVLVYDLGGGTFDATLMELEGRHYRMRATAGDVHLGGIDWNQRIVDHLAQLFEEKHGVDLREDPAALQWLMIEAEDVKRALTTRAQTVAHIALEGRRLQVPITRSEFERLTEDLAQRTLFTVQKLLREASVPWNELTRLLLVGGSTRMPMIQQLLTQQYGMPCDRSLSPDEAVAHGAAIYAHLVLHAGETERPEVDVTNVNSHDLGVLGIEQATGRKRRQVLIPRNTSLPASGVGVFVTGRQDQASVAVNVVEGGDASGKNATRIGKCVVRELPLGLAAKTPVEVKFHYAANGRLTVGAWLPTVERKAKMTIERSSGMSDLLFRQWEQRIAECNLLPSDQQESGAVVLRKLPDDEAQIALEVSSDVPSSQTPSRESPSSFNSLPDPEEVESLLDEPVMNMDDDEEIEIEIEIEEKPQERDAATDEDTLTIAPPQDMEGPIFPNPDQPSPESADPPPCVFDDLPLEQPANVPSPPASKTSSIAPPPSSSPTSDSPEQGNDDDDDLSDFLKRFS